MKLPALVGLGVFIFFVVLMDAGPGDAARGTRRQCRQTCGPRIAQDCAGFRKAGRRACRRAILRSCRRVSLEACFLTPAPTVATTTTTSLAAATTQLLPTTTQDRPTTTIGTSTTDAPTTSVPPTTTTTLPFHYGGDWTFSGDLTHDTCDTDDPSSIDVDVFVSHVPSDSTIGVAMDSYPVAFGTADPDRFDAARVFLADGCIVSVAFAAEVTSDPDLMAAAFAIRSDCVDGSCTVAYEGDLAR